MKAVAVAVAVLLAGQVRADEDEYVKTVTDENFKQVIGAAPLALVEFYAPWCGHCKALAPKFEEAAKILAADDPPVMLAKCDAEKETKQARLNSVSSFPTLIIYRDGEKGEAYGGSRDSADEIVEYMRTKTGPSSTALTGAKEVKAQFHRKNLDHVAVVGYFPSASPAYKTYMTVANQLRDIIKMYHVTDSATLENLGFHGVDGSIFMYRPWAPAKQFKLTYKGQIEGFAARVKKFITSNTMPELGYVPAEHSQFVWDAKLPILRGLVKENDENRKAHTEKYVAQMKDALEEYRGKVQFVVQDEEKFDDQMFYDGEIAKGEAIVLRWDGKRYQYKQDEHKSVANFLKLYFEKNLEEFLKSEAPAPQAAADEVQVVTGSTFKKYVLDETKDVLIEFYAPWCGHCKRLEPEYNKLAELLKDEPSIIVAKLDATVNDVSHPKYQAQGFPTIKYATSTGKDAPLDYNGDRTAEAMAQYVREKATTKLANSEL